jgi:hypothetical protein
MAYSAPLAGERKPIRKEVNVGEDVSRLRLYLMRAVYFLTFVGVGYQVWPTIIAHEKEWDPLRGVAFSFWGAYTVLMGLGIRYPLQMVPLLLLQLFYKSVWLLAVAPSLSSAGDSTGMTKMFAIVVLVDLVVIPWRYVIAQYIRKPSERWR